MNAHYTIFCAEQVVHRHLSHIRIYRLKRKMTEIPNVDSRLPPFCHNRPIRALWLCRLPYFPASSSMWQWQHS